MVITKKFLYAKHFTGMPKETDFELVEEELPEIKDGEFLCKAEYFSVDPYMRSFSDNYHIGMTMCGTQIGRIIESKTSQYPVDCHVLGNFGWQTYAIYNREKYDDGMGTPYLLLPSPGHPISIYLSVLGMPGNTAYFGLTECCNPKRGETVLISGAGGAVGNHVGQIAKLMGCTVFGITGSDEKGEWLKSIYFDGYINYKTVDDFPAALRQMAPRGIDCYFDNVGGELSSQVMQQMNKYGRVAVCGWISSYNESSKSVPKATIIQPSVVHKLLTIKGLQVWSYIDRWEEGVQKNRGWLQRGLLKHEETRTKGFENLPKAFIGMLNGENMGKAIVTV